MLDEADGQISIYKADTLMEWREWRMEDEAGEGRMEGWMEKLLWEMRETAEAGEDLQRKKVKKEGGQEEVCTLTGRQGRGKGLGGPGKEELKEPYSQQTWGKGLDS